MKIGKMQKKSCKVKLWIRAALCWSKMEQIKLFEYKDDEIKVSMELYCKEKAQMPFQCNLR